MLCLSPMSKVRCLTVSTPLANNFKISLEQCPKSDAELNVMSKIPYATKVGCLMYDVVCTRTDLAQAASQVYKFTSKMGKQHWKAVKWILMYLNSIVDRGVM